MFWIPCFFVLVQVHPSTNFGLFPRLQPFTWNSPTPTTCETDHSKTRLFSTGATSQTSTSTSTTTRTLYGSQGSRSPLINWAAYELQLPLQMGNLSRNPHPFGQIPCLTDENNVLVFESGAILQYLYSQKQQQLQHSQVPSQQGQDSSARQAAILSWIVWANASLDPICFLNNSEGRVFDTGLRKSNRKIDTLNEILAQQEYLVALEDSDSSSNSKDLSKDSFSVADVAVASYLLYVLQFFPDVDLTQWPHIIRYMKQCAERPSYGKAFGNKVQDYLVSSLNRMILSMKEENDDEEEGEGEEGNGDEKNPTRKLFGIF